MPAICQGRSSISSVVAQEDRVSLSKSTVSVSLMTAVSRFSGFIAIMVLAGALGSGVLADSYNLASTMPNMLFELLIGGVLTSVFVPVFVEQVLDGRQRSWRVAANFVNVSTVFLVGVALFGTFFSFYFVRVQTFLVKSTDPSVTAASLFFKFFVWQIVFYGLTGIVNGILQSLRRFTVPAMAPIFNNVVVIATVLFVYMPLRSSHPVLAVYALALGTTMGIAAMALVQIPALLREGYRHQFVFDLRDPALRKLAVLALPVLGYVASNQVGLTVSNVLAYQFRGGMTAFAYAWRFFQLPYGIISVSIATVLFTGIAEAAARQDMDKLKQRLSQGIRATGFIVLPVSMFMFVFSRPIIIVTLRHGIFTTAGAERTANVLAYFVIGLLPFSTFLLLARVFYALKDTATPMKVNALGVPINIALDVLLVRFYGVTGLSMGHSITYTVTSVIMLLALRRRIGSLGIPEMGAALGKFSLLSFLVGVIMVAAMRLTGLLDAVGFWPNIKALISGGVFTAVVYGIGSYMGRFAELRVLSDIVTRRAKKI